MKYIAQFKIPGQEGGQTLEAPGGIPEELQGADATQNLVQLGLDWLFIGAATLSVIFIIYSGIQWITSQGDPQKIAAAKARLMYSIIGLVVVAAAFLIVRVIISALGGDADFFFDFNNLSS